MEFTLICRSDAANEAFRLEFERLSWKGLDEARAVAAMRLYWLDRCRPSIEQFRNYYDSHYLPQRLRETLTLVPNRPSSYLDVGYGDGRVTAALVRRWRLDQHSATGVELVRSQGSSDGDFLRLIMPDSSKWSLPLPTSSVHLVTLFHVLHHSPTPVETVLAEVRRVLRSDGCLIVREHDATTHSRRLFLQFVEVLFDQVVLGGQRTPVRTCRYRRAEDWVDALNKCGLSTQRMVCFLRRRHHLDVDLQCVPEPARVP